MVQSPQILQFYILTLQKDGRHNLTPLYKGEILRTHMQLYSLYIKERFCVLICKFTPLYNGEILRTHTQFFSLTYRSGFNCVEYAKSFLLYITIWGRFYVPLRKFSPVYKGETASVGVLYLYPCIPLYIGEILHRGYAKSLPYIREYFLFSVILSIPIADHLQSDLLLS